MKFGTGAFGTKNGLNLIGRQSVQQYILVHGKISPNTKDFYESGKKKSDLQI